MKIKKGLLVAVVAFSMLLSTFVFYAYQVVNAPNLNVEKEQSFFYIATGSTFQDVQEKSKSAGNCGESGRLQFFGQAHGL